MNKFNLIELQLDGLRFAWQNNREVGEDNGLRLGLILISAHWLLTGGPKLFNVEPYWLEDPLCEGIVGFTSNCPRDGEETLDACIPE